MSTVSDVAGSDPTLPAVELIIGGKTRHLVYDHNSIVHAEKATGINLLKAAVSDVSATNMRGLLWASLLHESPDLTLDEVGAWIRPSNVAGIRESLLRAWFESVPEPKPGDGAGGAEAQATPTA